MVRNNFMLMPCKDPVMITAKIDGKTLNFAEGISVLDAAHAAGAEVPVLCEDSRLKSCGACRTCLVEIAGQPRPVASCMTELKAGMEVTTRSRQLDRSRTMNLRMLARRYPADAFEQYPDKPFHVLAREHGLGKEDFLGRHDPELIDDSHPYFHVDMSRCIDCYRCVRICDEVQGQFVWQVVNRGQTTHVVPDDVSMEDSSCVSCGACVDTCPTGALEDRSILQNGGAPTTWTKTVCPYCGTGCEMYAGTRDGKIVQVKPALEAPVNSGHLCVKGRYAFGFVDAPDRITEPMIRRNDHWQQVSWTDAIEYTTARLREIIERHGKESVAVLGSARATNEENYLTQKFARVVLGTNNVDCCARVCHTPSAAAMKMMLGTGAATNSFADIELTRTILICGANPTENHPIVGERMKQAVIQNGTKLIVIDPREIELAKYADIHLQLRAGTNLLLLNAIAHAIIEEGLADKTFIDDRVLEYEEYRSFVSDYSPENVAERCGVEAELIRSAARMYASAKPAMCFHGLGTTEHTQGTEGVMALINLALLTGNIGKRGTGINPLRGQNNVQGCAQMGCDPGILTGSIAVAVGRDAFEAVWNAPVPTEKGLNAIEIVDAAGTGDLKALWAIGYDIYLSHPNASKTAAAFRQLELLIVQDMFMNETAREFGHVFFPVASSFEKDGTFMNAERRIQRVRKAIEPHGRSKSDWEVICELARSMGKGEYFNFNNPEEIWNEVRAVWPDSAGITYARIENEGLQWPCPSESETGEDVLHKETFGEGKQTKLRRIKYRPTTEVTSADFPILLTTGRSLYQFNAGTMTLRTPNAHIRPTDLVVVNPLDAADLSLLHGELVRMASRWGEVTLPVAIGTEVKPGEAFATFHTPEVFLNRITGNNRDRYVQAPEYKVTAVRISRLAE
ncbi:MAG TPA: formate dehydrogenase subunit alpha [Pyrinomonadaceae bacterium]